VFSAFARRSRIKEMKSDGCFLYPRSQCPIYVCPVGRMLRLLRNHQISHVWRSMLLLLQRGRSSSHAGEGGQIACPWMVLLCNLLVEQLWTKQGLRWLRAARSQMAGTKTSVRSMGVSRPCVLSGGRSLFQALPLSLLKHKS